MQPFLNFVSVIYRPVRLSSQYLGEKNSNNLETVPKLLSKPGFPLNFSLAASGDFSPMTSYALNDVIG